MKTLTIALFFIALGLQHSQAQINLVPNPSFEILDSCPNRLGEIEFATGWFSRGQTPDYFNLCDTLPNFPWDISGVPFNTLGYQFPLLGEAYAGYHGFSTYKEYLSIRLSTNLTIGTKYYVSFYVTAATGSNSQFCRYTTNNQGLLFSCDSNQILSEPNISSVNQNIIISDTVNWTKVSGSIIADSAYSFVSLGNFYADSLTSVDILNSSSISQTAYYYLENVCVSNDSILCNTLVGNDEIQFNLLGRIYPNPTTDFIKVSPTLPIYNYCIYDVLGNVVQEGNQNGESQIDVNFLSNSIYFVRFSFSRLTYKFIKL